MQPEMVLEAIENVKAKKNPASLHLVRFESFEERKVAKISV